MRKKNVKWPTFLLVTNFGLFKVVNKEIYVFFNVMHKKEKAIVSGNFFGVSWNEKAIWLTKGNNLYKIKDRDNFYIVKNDKFDFDDIHQILCLSDLIFIVNTGRDCVTIVKDINEEGIRLLKTIKMDQKDCHINSIFYHKDKFYVCAHNKDKPSFINIYSKNFYFIDKIENVGFQNHNVYVENDVLYSLSSSSMKIFKYNLITKERNFIELDFNKIGLDKNKCYFKGLAKSENNFLIGICHAEKDKKKRNIHSSWILLLDNDFNYVDKMYTSRSDQIKDLRIVNETDFAHNNLIFYSKTVEEGLKVENEITIEM